MTWKIKCFIGLIVVALAAGIGYFGYYLPRTPLYTITLIQRGISDKDPAAVFKQVDINSIVDNAVEREIESNPDVKNKYTKALAKLLKPVAKDAIKEVAVQKITAQAPKDQDPSIKDGVVGLVEKFTHRLDPHEDDPKDIQVRNLSVSTDANNIATYVVTLENPQNHRSIDLRLTARQLDDGTWQIYDIPNLIELQNLLGNN